MKVALVEIMNELDLAEDLLLLSARDRCFALQAESWDVVELVDERFDHFSHLLDVFAVHLEYFPYLIPDFLSPLLLASQLPVGDER